MSICPCKDCNVRHSGCHASCEDYKSWSAEQKKMKDLLRQEKEREAAFYGHKHPSHHH